MRRLMLSLLICFFLFSPLTDAISIPLGEKAPDFSLKTIDGVILTPVDFKDKILILLFWRPNQQRSLDALKDVNEVVEKYRKRNVEAITIIEESESVEDAKKILQGNEIKLPLTVDNERVAYGDYGVRVHPTTVIIDAKGILKYDIPSHAPTYRTKLEAYIKRLVGEITDEELKNILSFGRTEKDEATMKADRRYNLAMKFVKRKMYDQAIEMAKMSIDAKPDMAKSHILLGFLYLNNNDPDSALEEFEMALKIKPDSKDAMTGKGGALLMLDRVDEAIAILNKATVTNPYSEMAYYELGKAYEIKQDKDSAIKMYRKALDKIISKTLLPSLLSKCD